MNEYVTSIAEAEDAIYKGRDIEVENLKVYDDVRTRIIDMAEFFAETGHWKLFSRCQEQVEKLDKAWGDRYNNIVIGPVVRVPIVGG